MIGAVKGFFASCGMKIALWILDKVLKSIVEGSITDANMELIGEKVDSWVDTLQYTIGETGKATRAKVIALCLKVVENLQEPDGQN